MERITAVHAISRETYELKSVKYFFSYDTSCCNPFPECLRFEGDKVVAHTRGKRTIPET